MCHYCLGVVAIVAACLSLLYVHCYCMHVIAACVLLLYLHVIAACMLLLLVCYCCMHVTTTTAYVLLLLVNVCGAACIFLLHKCYCHCYNGFIITSYMCTYFKLGCTTATPPKDSFSCPFHPNYEVHRPLSNKNCTNNLMFLEKYIIVKCKTCMYI